MNRVAALAHALSAAIPWNTAHNVSSPGDWP